MGITLGLLPALREPVQAGTEKAKEIRR